MTTRGTKKPYVSFLGNATTEVTGSMWLVRFQKYCILLDCGLIQGHDIVTDYKKNQEQLKKIKPKEIDWIILDEVHADHSCLVPALYARGCNAHLIVPTGSKELLKLLWYDSCKIMTQDCIKIQRKHNIKAIPFYNEKDIEKAYDRIIEIDKEYNLTPNIKLTFYEANHILYAKQIYLEMTEGYKKTRVAFTGDIGGNTEQPYIPMRETMPFADLMIGENTYNTSERPNKSHDREKDLDKIATAIGQYKKIVFPIFSLGRCQTIMTILYNLWKQNRIPHDIRIVVDSPLAIKFCKLYPEVDGWENVRDWKNVIYINEWGQSVEEQESNRPLILLSAGGFMSGGRIRSWLKTILPDKNAIICYCGFSGENGTAYEIRHGDKKINIDGELISNNCNILELVSFSSHANYEELIDYYSNKCKFNKIALVHGNYEHKVNFCKILQEILVEQGKSARVICTNKEQKIYI